MKLFNLCPSEGENSITCFNTHFLNCECQVTETYSGYCWGKGKVLGINGEKMNLTGNPWDAEKTKPWVQQELKQLLSLLFSPLARSLFFLRIGFVFLFLLAGFLCLPGLYTAHDGCSSGIYMLLWASAPTITISLFSLFEIFWEELDWLLFFWPFHGLAAPGWHLNLVLSAVVGCGPWNTKSW